MEYVLDLDVICPKERTLTLGGKKFVIQIVPAEIGIRAYNLQPLLTTLEKGEIKEEDYNKFFDIIFEVLKNADKTLTKEWLKAQINIDRFNEIVTFIWQAIYATSKKNEVEEDSPKSS